MLGDILSGGFGFAGEALKPDALGGCVEANSFSTTKNGVEDLFQI